MSDNNGIKLVCFDVGGVIIRICRDWAEGCAAAGIDLRHQKGQFLALRDQWGELVRKHQIGVLPLESYIRDVSALVDNLYTPAEVEAVHHAWLREEFEGVGLVIDEIHGSGIATAALSNTNHAHWARMDNYPAMMRLHHWFASHEMGLHKPDEAIYRALESATGMSASQIVFFDDMEENIAAATKLSWRAMQIDPLTPTAPQIRAALIQQGALNGS